MQATVDPSLAFAGMRAQILVYEASFESYEADSHILRPLKLTVKQATYKTRYGHHAPG